MFLVSQGKKNKIDFENPSIIDHRQIGTMNQEIKIEKKNQSGTLSTNKLTIKNKIDLKYFISFTSWIRKFSRLDYKHFQNSLV